MELGPQLFSNMLQHQHQQLLLLLLRWRRMLMNCVVDTLLK
jgi:hypothetical protein